MLCIKTTLYTIILTFLKGGFNMKKNKKQSGFVLAYTVIIMGIVFVVMAVIVALVATQNTRMSIIKNNFEEQMFISQQQYNFENLSYDNYSSYLNSNAINVIHNQNSNDFVFDKYIVNLSLDYTHLIVQDVETKNILCDVSR